ncbi:Neuroendocrine protein 7B2 [Nymphon striatum]|nr:Neuroendocrine protein 7B2 [Nymphon striatum]
MTYNQDDAGYDLPDYRLTDAWLKELVNSMDSDFNSDFLEAPTKDNVVVRHPQLLGQDLFSGRVTKDEEANAGFGFGSSQLKGNPMEPSIRDHEYLQHSTLWGNQYVAGGAGEGSQHLKPDGSLKNPHEIKTEPVLPAYCNPPNPCPVGYTEADGCITDFANTASFSREFQSSQECMCDTEHMFDCPVTSSDSNNGGNGQVGRSYQGEEMKEKQIATLAQSISNQGLNSNNIDQLIKQVEGNEKSHVAKKFSKEKYINPYLRGEKLPVQAKKSPGVFS